MKIPGEENLIEAPSHYNSYKGFEVMDICDQMRSSDGNPSGTWRRANAVKYLLRAGLKEAGNLAKEIEDLNKARQYIGLEIARLETLQMERDQIREIEEGWLEQGADATPSWLEQFESEARANTREAPLSKKPPVRWNLKCPTCDGKLITHDHSPNNFFCPDGHGAIVMPEGPMTPQNLPIPEDVEFTASNDGMTPSHLGHLVKVDHVKDGVVTRVKSYMVVSNPDRCGNAECIIHPETLEVEVPK